MTRFHSTWHRQCSFHTRPHDDPHVGVCSIVSDSATPWTVARQAPLSMGFSRQEYWSGLPFPSPGDLSWPRDGTHIPAWQADSLPLRYQGSFPCIPKKEDGAFQCPDQGTAFQKGGRGRRTGWKDGWGRGRREKRGSAPTAQGASP